MSKPNNNTFSLDIVDWKFTVTFPKNCDWSVVPEPKDYDVRWTIETCDDNAEYVVTFEGQGTQAMCDINEWVQTIKQAADNKPPMTKHEWKNAINEANEYWPEMADELKANYRQHYGDA